MKKLIFSIVLLCYSAVYANPPAAILNEYTTGALAAGLLIYSVKNAFAAISEDSKADEYFHEELARHERVREKYNKLAKPGRQKVKVMVITNSDGTQSRATSTEYNEVDKTDFAKAEFENRDRLHKFLAAKDACAVNSFKAFFAAGGALLSFLVAASCYEKKKQQEQELRANQMKSLAN